MKATKKTWTPTDYYNEAREFIACYGHGYNWCEFVEEYCATWDRTSEFARPSQDLLLNAILRAELGWQ